MPWHKQVLSEFPEPGGITPPFLLLRQVPRAGHSLPQLPSSFSKEKPSTNKQQKTQRGQSAASKTHKRWKARRAQVSDS